MKPPPKKKTEASPSLWTDLYQITTSAAYYMNRVNVKATFELYVKGLPPSRSYLIAAGLEQVVDFLESFRFSAKDIDFLKNLPELTGIPDEFFSYLRELRFTGDMWAIPEGTPFFAGEPVIRISAPIVEAQLVESYILGVVNYQVTVASKAARIVEAAGDKRVIDFGFRRAPSPEAAHHASRAAYLAGFDATSNLEAGRRYGIPVIGTVPYSFVLAFESEQEALRHYAGAFSDGALVLIDTVSQKEATREVIACGEKLRGVRISSRDLLELSRDVRSMLDDANHQGTEIIASGELNENKILQLVEAGAPIDSYGVGAELVYPRDASMVEGVYRLVEIKEKKKTRYPAKFFSGRETLPARKQILRRVDESGGFVEDRIVKAGTVPEENETAYVKKIVEGGKLIDPLPTLKDSRNYCIKEKIRLPGKVRRLSKPRPYPVKLGRELLDLCAGDDT